MGRKKKKHIYLYDPEAQKKIEELRRLFPELTYDQIFLDWLKLPTTELVIRKKYEEVEELMMRNYRDEKIKLLMDFFWILIIKAAKGEYDIQKLLYDLDADIRANTYKKR